MNIESIVFYILLLDAVLANVYVYYKGSDALGKHLSFISQTFPHLKGLAIYYLVLVLIVGIVLYKLNTLVLPW